MAIDGLPFQADREAFGVLNSFSLVAMIFLQRDYPVTVRTTPSRILYFVTCVAAFMVFAFYTAVLTSYMTAQDAPPQIKVRDVVLISSVVRTLKFPISHPDFSRCVGQKLQNLLLERNGNRRLFAVSRRASSH